MDKTMVEQEIILRRKLDLLLRTGKILVESAADTNRIVRNMNRVAAYLGLPEEKMIAPMDEKRGKLLLAEILNGGNFGQHFTKYGHFTQQGMAKKYFLKIWRNMHFVRYYPAEALSEPIFRTWHFFWRLKYKK